MTTLMKVSDFKKTCSSVKARGKIYSKDYVNLYFTKQLAEAALGWQVTLQLLDPVDLSMAYFKVSG